MKSRIVESYGILPVYKSCFLYTSYVIFIRSQMTSDALTQKYLRALTHRQHGGSVDIVFRGARRWGGTSGPDKFGGSAKDMFRTVAPYIARGASKFLLDTASSFSKGADLKDAMKGAVLPALVGAFNGSTTSEAKGKSAQAGKGKLRRLLGIKAGETTAKTRKVSKRKRKTRKSDKTRKPRKTRKTRKTRKVKQARRRKVSAEALNF